jgi:hypothetical protein
MIDILINCLLIGCVGVFVHMWLNWLVDTALEELNEHDNASKIQPLDTTDTW